MTDLPSSGRGIAAESLNVRYGARQPLVVDGVSLRVEPGTITALIGPNGSGKSTLLKTIARQIAPESGAVILNGRDIHTFAPKVFARSVGILFQEHAAPGELTVEELVTHGRFPHVGTFQSLSQTDMEAVEHALHLTGLLDLRHRRISQLSGGQRQLAWIAMALAQQTEFLLLDEPTTFLDVAHQFEVMDLIRSLNQQHAKTIVLVLHDLNLAARYADTIVAMRDGKISAQGRVDQVLNADVLRKVFDIEARIIRDEETGALYCVPERRSTGGAAADSR